MSFDSMLIFFSNKDVEHAGICDEYSRYGMCHTWCVTEDDAGSAPPSCFGTGHVTVLSSPPRKTEYAGVVMINLPVHLICSACSEQKE